MLYQFCFSLSQRCDSLQEDNGIFLKFCLLTDEGIDTQRVLGTAVGSRSGKREIVHSAKNSSELLQEVVKEAIENEYLITLMINDWTNVYTKRRATDESTSIADNFCTVISRLSKTSRPFHGRRLKPFTTPRELMWKVYLFFFFHSPLLKTSSVICSNITWVISFIFWSINGETTLGSQWLPCGYNSQKYAIILWCASSRLCKVAFKVQGKLWNCIRLGSSKPS